MRDGEWSNLIKKKNVECVCCDVAGFGPLGLYSVLGVLSYQFSYLIPFRYVHMFRNMNTGKTPMDSHTPVNRERYRCLTQKLFGGKSPMLTYGK